MSFIGALESMNSFLNQSYFFQAFKFLLGLYLIIITLFVILVLYKFWTDYKKVLVQGSGYRPELGKFQLRWNKINEQVEAGDPNGCSAAVLECSQMLNDVLKAIGYEGDSLGERLDNILPSQLDNLEKLKETNEIKNKIVKDPDFKVSQVKAAEIRDVVGRTLDTFEVIEIDE